MHFLSTLWHGLWIARVGLEAVLLMLLVRRRFYLQFPMFSLFIAWAVLQGTTLVTMDFTSNGPIYYWTYVRCAIVDDSLGFAVIYELFRRVLRDYPVLSSTGRSLYRWAIFVLIMAALIFARTAPPAGQGKLISTVYELQSTVRLLQCGLLAFLFVFVQSFHLSWRNRALGIALGFGISASVSLALAAIRSQIETISPDETKNILNLVSQMGDICGVAVWIAYVAAREKMSGPKIVTLPEHDMGSWNRELRRLLP
jgi:hypothetical protein